MIECEVCKLLYVVKVIYVQKKKKGIYHRHPIFINLKSNTMKNTVQK